MFRVSPRRFRLSFRSRPVGVMRVVAFVAIVGLCVLGPTVESAGAQQTAESVSPSTAPSSSLAERHGVASTALFETGKPFTVIGELISGLHGDLANRLDELMRTVEETSSPQKWALFVLVSLLYGIVHAALPGHRKTLLVSYFLAEDADPEQGLLAGALVALLQVLSATVLVFGGLYLLDAGLSGTLHTGTAWIRNMTAVGVAALGGLLFVLRMLEFFRTRNDWRQQKVMSSLSPLDTRIDPDNQDPAVHLVAEHSRRLRRRRRSNASWLPAAVISGAVPAPGVALVLLLAASYGVWMIGIAAVGVIALGMALTLAAVSVATIVVKERIVDLLRARAAHYTHLSMELVGALILIVFGVVVIVTGIG